MHGLQLFFAAASMAGPIVAYPQSNAGVPVIDNPGGGTIAYAQLPVQHSVGRDMFCRACKRYIMSLAPALCQNGPQPLRLDRCGRRKQRPWM